MSNLRDLTGKTALVMGATGVIGQRVCAQLAAAGARVIIHYRQSTEIAERIVAEHPGAVAVKWQEGEDFTLLAEAAGVVDILVNALHMESGTGSVAEVDVDVLRRHLESVVLHAQLCQLVIPAMRAAGWGRIVYVSGALMTRPAPGMGAFGAAKAAATTLTRYLALEEGRAGITANIVAPGRVVDPGASEDLDPKWAVLAQELKARTALGRFPTPEEVATAITSLVMPQSSGITGQTVWVTGGEPIS